MSRLCELAPREKSGAIHSPLTVVPKHSDALTLSLVTARFGDPADLAESGEL